MTAQYTDQYEDVRHLQDGMQPFAVVQLGTDGCVLQCLMCGLSGPLQGSSVSRDTHAHLSLVTEACPHLRTGIMSMYIRGGACI